MRSICENIGNMRGIMGEKVKQLRGTNENLKIVDINIDNLLKDMYT